MEWPEVSVSFSASTFWAWPLAVWCCWFLKKLKFSKESLPDLTQEITETLRAHFYQWTQVFISSTDRCVFRVLAFQVRVELLVVHGYWFMSSNIPSSWGSRLPQLSPTVLGGCIIVKTTLERDQGKIQSSRSERIFWSKVMKVNMMITGKNSRRKRINTRGKL